MSSNLRPSRWSLQARLLLGQSVLLVAVCLGVAVVTGFALHRYLVGELDSQLIQIAGRSAMMERRPPPPPIQPPPPGPAQPPQPGQRAGPGPDFLGAPGQPVRTVGAIVSGGTVVRAGALGADGERVRLSGAATDQLFALAGRRAPVTADIDGLGRYRLMAFPARTPGVTAVIGLSMVEVQATLRRVALIFAVVTALALTAGILLGLNIIRRALAPLNRVVATAVEVADLPLDRGEAGMPIRVDAADANPNTEVGRLGLAVNRMLDHIAAALSTRAASEARMRRFVADASHELRTPLAAIRGYTELAQRRTADMPAEVAHAMNRVESQADRMTTLVDDLLLLARLDSGRPLERRPVDVCRLCADAISDAHAAGPGHQWNLDVPPTPVLVTGDEARLHQAVANLLANARVHTPAGTTVTVSLRAGPETVALRVCDDGPGIPEDLQSEVFERFSRADTARTHADGSTGLGLAIVAAVVRAHGGEVTVRSSPGDTVFEVRLPTQFAGSAGRV